MMRLLSNWYIFLVLPAGLCLAAFSHGQPMADALERKLENYKANFHKTRVYLETDRFSYQPGDIVWFHALATDLHANGISKASQKLQIRLRDYEGNVLFSYDFDLVEGMVSSRLALPENIESSIYYLEAGTEKSLEPNPYMRAIEIQQKALPDFLLQLEFSDKTYYPGDAFDGMLRIADYFNEPLRGIQFNLKISNGDRPVLQLEEKTGGSGMVPITFEIPTRIESTGLAFTISAIGKNGAANLSGIIPVYSENYSVIIFAEGHNLLDGVESKVGALVLDAYGQPLKGQAALIDEGGKVLEQMTMDSLGYTEFTFTPQFYHRYYFRLLEPFLSEKIIELPPILQGGYNLVLDEQTKENITLEIVNTTGIDEALLLIGLQDGEIAWKSIHNPIRNEKVDIPVDQLHGRSCFFTLFGPEEKILAERYVHRVAEEIVVSDLPLDQREYKQREKVRIPADQILISSGEELVFTSFSAAYDPWSLASPLNTSLADLSIPLDYLKPMRFVYPASAASLYNTTGMGLSLVFQPDVFNWQRILEKEKFQGWWEHPVLVSARAQWLRETIFNHMIRTEGKTVYSNTSADSYFIASNPELVKFLEKTPKKTEPPYKTLLQGGMELPDVIHTMKPYELINNKIVFYGSRNSISYQEGALIVVDGMQMGQNPGILRQINPYDVDEINISTRPMDIHRYTGFNSVGLIEITTKRGPQEKELKVKNKDLPDAFPAPDYDKRSYFGKGPDLRLTLFWHTAAASETGSWPSIEYFNADLRGRVNVQMNTLLGNGKILIMNTMYNVR